MVQQDLWSPPKNHVIDHIHSDIHALALLAIKQLNVQALLWPHIQPHHKLSCPTYPSMPGIVYYRVRIILSVISSCNL
jgi:hypothetical protein